MSSVDDRVVAMSFENDKFESGAKQSISTLGKLTEALDFSKTKDNVNNIDVSGLNSKLSAIANSVSGISHRFSALGIAAAAAIGTIASQATRLGERLVSAFTINPIKDGLANYETQINAIQTILANTQGTGVGLKQVNSTLAELNQYANQTVYNFADMAKNIGTFTAAGVGLKESTASIKGIANLAALSGSNSEQAATAMYQLSQAIAAGSVKLQDWNSVVNAGLGGKVFQEALFNTAKQMGTIKDVPLDETFKQWTAAGNSFRGSLQKGWITSKVLTQTLSQFTGDLTDAQLKSLGYTNDQVKAIQQQAKVAKDAATKIKTLSALTSALKDEAATGWASTFAVIIGNMAEAQKIYTGLDGVIGGYITRSSQARQKILKDWKALGGRTILINGITDAFHELGAVVKPIQNAFRDIFPKETGKSLTELSRGFKSFVDSFKIGAKTADEIHRSFAGVFALFDIGWRTVKALGEVVFDLFRTMGVGSGGILKTTANIGDFLVKMDDAVKHGTRFNAFFVELEKVLKVPLTLLASLKDVVVGVFEGFKEKNADLITNAVDRVQSRFALLGKAGQLIINTFKLVDKAITPFIQDIKLAFSKLGDALADALKTGNFNNVFDVLNTVLLGGITAVFAKFFKSGLKIDFGNGLLGSLGDTFEALTGQLKAMEQNVKADTLEKIAAAVGVLTVSVVALSLIDSQALTKALTAMAVGFGELLGALAVLTKIGGLKGFLKVPVIAAALDLITLAILGLSGAVAILATLSWEQLSKGLTGIAGLLTIISVAVIPLSKSSGGLITVGLGMVGIATALVILSGAVKIFGSMNWTEIGKGLGSIAGALVLIAGAMHIMPKNMLITGAGLLAVGVGINAIAGAVAIFATMDPKTVAKGLVEIGSALAVIAGAMHLMPANMVLTAGALLLVAVSVGMISKAIEKMGQMSWSQIAKGLVALAGGLGILVAAMALMTGTIPGALAMIVVAGAVTLLANGLTTLSKLSWMGILKSLVALAAALATLAAAALLMTPIIPELLALGAALLVFGAALALAGVGIALFGTGFTALAAGGAAGVSVLLSALKGVIDLLPYFGTQLAKGLVNFVTIIGDNAGPITDAYGKIIGELIDKTSDLIPKMGALIVKLIQTLLTVVVSYEDQITRAGLKMIQNFLDGVDNAIPGIVKAVGKLVIDFLTALAREELTIANAGFQLIIGLINAIAAAIPIYAKQLHDAGVNLAKALIEGLVIGLTGDSLKSVYDAVGNMGKGIISAGKKALHINSPSKDFIKIGQSVTEGFVVGLTGSSSDISKAYTTLNANLTSGIRNAQDTITAGQKKLQTLLAAKKLNPQEISDTNDKILQAQKELAKYTAARGALVSKTSEQEKKALQTLASQYDKNADKLKTYQQQLADAKKTRDDYATSTQEQFSDLPQIDNLTGLSQYESAIADQTAANNKYAASLKQLENEKLNDDLYKKLVSDGTADQAFVDQIIAGGQAAVDQINAQDAALQASAKTIGDTASKDLYQAGVDAAQGLVDGLTSKQKDLKKQMDALADEIVDRVKKKLKIKSPSRVFMEIGKFTMQGLANGLAQSTHLVSNAVSDVGDTAVDSITQSLKAIPDITGEINANPTITPVLDLTQFRKDAFKMTDIVASTPVTATVTTNQASATSTDTQQAKDDASNEPVSTTVYQNYEQNITSPTALSTGDVYRQSKSLFALQVEKAEAAIANA